MLNICLDTSAYSLPCDVIPGEDKRRIEDQKAIFIIKKLSEKKIVDVEVRAYLTAGVFSVRLQHGASPY